MPNYKVSKYKTNAVPHFHGVSSSSMLIDTSGIPLWLIDCAKLAELHEVFSYCTKVGFALKKFLAN